MSKKCHSEALAEESRPQNAIKRDSSLRFAPFRMTEGGFGRFRKSSVINPSLTHKASFHDLEGRHIFGTDRRVFFKSAGNILCERGGYTFRGRGIIFMTGWDILCECGGYTFRVWGIFFMTG
jgi:hypothetical protein